MAQDLASKQLVWYDKEMLEFGRTWRCDDCGTVIEGREGYDRHVSCFPGHHPRFDLEPATKSPTTKEQAA